MKLTKVLKGIAFTLACFGMVFPYQSVMAGQPAQKQRQSRLSVVDVSLDKQSNLIGRVVNHQNVPEADVAVTLYNAKRELGTVKTNKDGYFVFKHLKGGLYRLKVKNNQQLFRVWTAQAAPPNAGNLLLVKTSKPVVRGQSPFDFTGVGGGTLFQLFEVGALTAAVTLSAVSLSKINDVEDEVNKIPKSP